MIFFPIVFNLCFSNFLCWNAGLLICFFDFVLFSLWNTILSFKKFFTHSISFYSKGTETKRKAQTDLPPRRPLSRCPQQPGLTQPAPGVWNSMWVHSQERQGPNPRALGCCLPGVYWQVAGIEADPGTSRVVSQSLCHTHVPPGSLFTFFHLMHFLIGLWLPLSPWSLSFLLHYNLRTWSK